MNKTRKYLLRRNYSYSLIANIDNTPYIAVVEKDIIKIVNYMDCEICYTFHDPTCKNVPSCNIDLSDTNRVDYISANETCPCRDGYFDEGEYTCQPCHYSWYKFYF